MRFIPVPFPFALCLAVAFAQALPSQNLVANPGFEAGNTGFLSDHSFVVVSNTSEGEYTISALPSTFNPFFVNPPAASSGSSMMMVVNGSTLPNQRVWSTSVQVTQGTTYRFQIAGCTAVAGASAILQWQVAGQPIGSQVPLPSVTQVWQIHGETWLANVTGTVEIAVRNLNTSAYPNDFYIDDLFVGPCLAAYWENYGSGWPGLQGVPDLVLSAPPVLGTTVDFRMRSVRSTSELGVLALGIAPANASTPLGGTLLVFPVALVGAVVVTAPTPWAWSLAIPNDHSLCGIEIYGQFAHTDPTASHGFAFSRGLKLVVGA